MGQLEHRGRRGTVHELMRAHDASKTNLSCCPWRGCLRLRYHFAKSEVRSSSDAGTANLQGNANRGKVFHMSRFYTDSDGDGDDVFDFTEAAAPRQLRLGGAGPLLASSSDVDDPDDDFAVPGRIVPARVSLV